MTAAVYFLSGAVVLSALIMAEAIRELVRALRAIKEGADG